MTKVTAQVRMALCWSMALLSMEARAQLEGTLFTEPEEREYLDYLREEFLRNSAAADFNIEDVPIPEIPAEVATVEEETTGPVEYNFGGVMSRRDGVRVWLNGMLLAESELPPGFSVVESGRGFSLRIVQNGQTFVLLPGQSVDVTRGTVIENFQRIQPPAATASVPDVVSDEPPAEEATTVISPVAEEATPGVGEAAATEAADLDTDALAAAASRLDDSAVDDLFEVLENRRLERSSGEESDEESNSEEP